MTAVTVLAVFHNVTDVFVAAALAGAWVAFRAIVGRR